MATSTGNGNYSSVVQALDANDSAVIAHDVTLMAMLQVVIILKSTQELL